MNTDHTLEEVGLQFGNRERIRQIEAGFKNQTPTDPNNKKVS